MADDILRDARHHQDLPRRQGAAGRQPLGAPRRDPRDLRRERRRQVHADEGAVRGLPARHLRGRDRLRRRAVPRSRDIRDSEHRGIVIIHQELALCPHLSIAENIFLGNEQATPRPDRLEPRPTPRRPSCSTGWACDENPVTKVARHRRRQAAARRDRQGAVQGGQAADPGRADRGAQRRGLARTCSTCCAACATQGITCVIISHKLNEIEAIADSHHDHARRPDRSRRSTWRPTRSPRTASSRAWSAATWSTASRPHAAHRRGGAADRGLDRAPSRTQHDRVVVDGANLTCARGEIVGLAGLMGAGRTELAMSVFGRSYGIDISGRVFKDGKEIQVRTVARGDRARHRLRHRGPQALRPEPHRRHQAQHLRRRRWASWPRAAGSTTTRSTGSPSATATSMNIKAPTRAGDHRQASAAATSRRSCCRKWIFADPDVLILDEPTRGIDVGAKYEIYTIINQLADEGKAVLVISSELPELLGICDRIYALSAGPHHRRGRPRGGHPGAPDAAT